MALHAEHVMGLVLLGIWAAMRIAGAARDRRRAQDLEPPTAAA